VLGPEKLPRVVSELGRWVGRARVMARQFREQLEEEVQLEQARKAQAAAAPQPSRPAEAAGAEAPPRSDAPGETHTPAGSPARAATSDDAPAEPVITRPPTYSHAHPTDATGADPTAPRSDARPSADERGT
jgi:sec-independent protein translocase protein TatB